MLKIIFALNIYCITFYLYLTQYELKISVKKSSSIIFRRKSLVSVKILIRKHVDSFMHLEYAYCINSFNYDNDINNKVPKFKSNVEFYF